MSNLKQEAIEYIELVRVYDINGSDILLGTTTETEITVTFNYKGETMTKTFQPVGYDRFKIKTNFKNATQLVKFTTTLPDPSIMNNIDLTGYRITLYRTTADSDLSDPSNIDLIFDGVIVGWTWDGRILVCNVAPFRKWNVSLPRSTFSYFCRHVFKGPRCGYTGDATECEKTPDKCYTGNFAGFPDIIHLQRKIYR